MEKKLSDEEIIHIYRSTLCKDYLAILYKRYVKKVHRTCLSFTRNYCDAEDFTHDIFIRAFSKIEQFKERSSFSTWLYAIAHNYCQDQLRAAKRLPVTGISENEADNVPEYTDIDSSQLMLQQLAQLLDTISPDKLTLLRLKYEDDLDSKEIAQLYNLKNSTVKMRLKRTRDQLFDSYRTLFLAS
ncbi:RNA polymerase sigma factor [Tellurirhabdus bombi]|uniref:RNA polymerase sigma factor n=1 Tax=Tellurirhabdus bombi TaxID=2907205 RepID=UPI001F2BCFFE|nr:RNA polymerase sigma factor [Tellurirhabdus bombi]